MANDFGAAKLLDALMLELIEKQVAIPRHVMDDLKAGRSLASIGRRNPGDADVAAQTMAILQSVEMNLLSLAEMGVDSAYADAWQGRIAQAYQEESAQAAPAAVRFVTGVPKSEHWIRMQASELAAIEGADDRLAALALSARPQEDGYILIHGKKEAVSAFLNEVREKVRQKTGKMGCECNN